MRIRIYDLEPSGHIQETGRSLTELSELRLQAQDCPDTHWVDISECGPGDLESPLAALALQPMELETCLRPPSGARLLPMSRSVFFEIPFEAALGHRGVVSCLCLPHLLVTMHERNPYRKNSALETLLKQADWGQASLASLVARIIAYISQESESRARQLRQQAIELEETLEMRGMELDPEDILRLKRITRVLDAIVDDQVVVLDLLLAGKQPVLNLATVGDEMRFCATALSAAERTMDRATARLRDVQSHYELQQQERTNRRLGVLTVISAIFMPLTLIAGIYGMNFENMPELSQPNAYFITLGGMAALGGGMYAFFRVRGWFG